MKTSKASPKRQGLKLEIKNIRTKIKNKKKRE
jgi:hypothetical protein